MKFTGRFALTMRVLLLAAFIGLAAWTCRPPLIGSDTSRILCMNLLGGVRGGVGGRVEEAVEARQSEQ